MSIEELQIEMLQLPENQRADLASALLQSLSPIATDEDEGVSEALRRDAEMDRADVERSIVDYHFTHHGSVHIFVGANSEHSYLHLTSALLAWHW